MKINHKLTTLLLLILSVGCGCNTFSKMFVKTGTEYIVRIETIEDNKAAIVEKSISVINNKLSSVGLDGDALKDPNDPNNIIVKVYGSQNNERNKTFLFTSYQLELRKVISPANPNPVKNYSTADAAKMAAKDGQEILPYLERIGSPGNLVILDSTVIVNGDDIRDAQALTTTDYGGAYLITFSLKPDAAARFGDWTSKNIGNYLAIVLDKKIQSIAYVKSQIFDSGEISGRFTKEEAEDIALSLKSGYLPCTMTVIDERQIEN